MSGARRRAAVWLAVLALALAALAPLGCGGGDDDGGEAGAGGGSTRTQAGLATTTIGTGETAAVILRPAGEPRRRPGIIFLHGWLGISPSFYDGWLRHLVREGNTVVYPVYQSPFTPPGRVLANALAGVRLALPRADVDPRTLVVAGHSAGGALAADYAATAQSVGLPEPLAVFAAYPGRRLRGVPIGIPTSDLGRIPASVRIEALGGAADTTVGTETAREIVADASRVPRERRRFVLVTDPAADDHLGPQRATAASRGAFWARLDALIAQARS